MQARECFQGILDLSCHRNSSLHNREQPMLAKRSQGAGSSERPAGRHVEQHTSTT